MTAQTKSAIRTGVITTVVGGLLLIAFSKVLGQVVLRPEFDAHLIENQNVHYIQAMRDSILLERTTDVLCEVKPSHRDC